MKGCTKECEEPKSQITKGGKRDIGRAASNIALLLAYLYIGTMLFSGISLMREIEFWCCGCCEHDAVASGMRQYSF